MKTKSKNQIEIPQHLIINGENKVLGRLASVVAKKLLNGYTIEIVNAEKCVISGNKKSIVTRYRQRTKIRTKSNPRRGPFHPHRADLIVKRTIRGMLPRKKAKGIEAYRRLRVYRGIPEHIKPEQITELTEVPSADKFNYRLLTVEELEKRL